MSRHAILSALAAVPLLIANSAPAWAQASTATLTATSTATCVRVGTDVPVTIALGNASNVSTVQATITYDPTVFEVPAKPTIGSSFPLAFRNQVDPATGRIELSASNSDAVNGSADFATITFRALKSAATQVGFDQSGSLVLTTTAENTNVLGSVTPLSLPACDAGVSNSNGNTNGSSGNLNTNGFVNVNTNTNGGISGQCAQPTEFSATAQGSGIVLTWKHDDSRLSNFIVHYGRTSGTFDTTFISNNSNTLRDGPLFRLTLENVSPGKTYYLAVSAAGNCQESAKTATISVQTNGSSAGGGTYGSTGSSGGNGTSFNNGSSGGTGSTYGSSTGGYGQGDFGGTGSTSVVNDGMTQKGQRFNSNFRGAAPYTGPKEAMMVAILSALAVGGIWMWRRGMA